MKIVYVTGCLGLIGSHITRLCLERNWYVIGVDSCTYVSNACHLEDFKKYKNFKFIKSDINDLETLYDCDYIINTAAETHVANSLVDSTKFFKTNISGVEKLLNLIRKLNNNTSFPTLIHFSSYEVYGNNCDSDVTEKSILNPVNPYSATKASADMVIQAFNATYNVPYIIVRPNCNYGVGQYVEKLIPKFCKYSLLKKKFPLHNGGTTTRTWLNASDTANAVMCIIDSGSKNEIFNVGLGDGNVTKIELAKLIKKEVTDLQKAGYGTPKSLGRGMLMGSSVAWAPGKSNYQDVEFNHAKGARYRQITELSESITLSVKSGHWASPSVVAHEHGHSLHGKIIGRDGFQNIWTWSKLSKEQRARIKPLAAKVSKYATTDPLEFVAETFAGHVAGKRYSKDIYDAYKELRGPKLKF